LYKLTGWIKNVDNTTSPFIGIAPTVTGAVSYFGSLTTEWVGGTAYYTATTTTPVIALRGGNNGKQARYDDIGLVPVTAASASGANIMSTKGGAVQNFSYKQASFALNEASYYVVIKRVR
jgi:hypothetical protein